MPLQSWVFSRSPAACCTCGCRQTFSYHPDTCLSPLPTPPLGGASTRLRCPGSTRRYTNLSEKRSRRITSPSLSLTHMKRLPMGPSGPPLPALFCVASPGSPTDLCHTGGWKVKREFVEDGGGGVPGGWGCSRWYGVTC